MSQYLQFLDNTTGAGTDGNISLEGVVTSLFPEEELSISNEGIGDFFKSIKNYFFSGKPSVSNMSGGWFNRMSVIQKTLAKTYLDPNWLNRRTFTQGEINAQKFVNLMSNNGSWTPDLLARVDAMVATMAEIRLYYETTTLNWYNQISPLIMHLNPDNLTFTDAFKLERGLARLDYPEFKYSYQIALGGTSINELEIRSRPSRVLSIPALDKESVVTTCQCILSVGEMFDRYNNMLEQIWRHPVYVKLSELIEATDEVPDRTQSTVHPGGTITTTTTQGSSDLDAELHRQFNIMQIFDTISVYNEMRYMATVVKAMAMYIDASVR